MKNINPLQSDHEVFDSLIEGGTIFRVKRGGNYRNIRPRVISMWSTHPSFQGSFHAGFRISRTTRDDQ